MPYLFVPRGIFAGSQCKRAPGIRKTMHTRQVSGEDWQDAEKLRLSVTPAKAGVQASSRRKSGTIQKTGSRFSPGTLDSCFRRNDALRLKGTLSATWKTRAFLFEVAAKICVLMHLISILPFGDQIKKTPRISGRTGAHPQFSAARIARRGERWMRNPGGKILPGRSSVLPQRKAGSKDCRETSAEARLL